MSFETILTIIGTASAMTGVYMYVQYEGSFGALMETHPEVDRKIAREVYGEMYRAALRGEYTDIPNADAETEFDKIFMQKVNARTLFPGGFK